MRQPEFLDVDPRELHLRPAQASGADPFKLQTQIARFGASTAGMPPPWVYRGSDGTLVIFNGVTRATRVARLASGAVDPGRSRGRTEAAGWAKPQARRHPAMMDPTRRELLQLIEELSAACPEYRFGQLVLNLAFLAREDGDQHVCADRGLRVSRRRSQASGRLVGPSRGIRGGSPDPAVGSDALAKPVAHKK